MDLGIDITGVTAALTETLFLSKQKSSGSKQETPGTCSFDMDVRFFVSGKKTTPKKSNRKNCLRSAGAQGVGTRLMKSNVLDRSITFSLSGEALMIPNSGISIRWPMLNMLVSSAVSNMLLSRVDLK